MNVVTFSETEAATTDAAGATELARGDDGRPTATYAEISRALSSF